MKDAVCSVCRAPKARLKCGLCEAAHQVETHLCKTCAHLINQDAFALMPEIPAGLAHSVYCPTCYSTSVAEPHRQYLEILERAKNVNVFEKDQKKETRFFSRKQKPVRVEACADREETLLRLAFMAAQGGFNGIIDVDIVPKKVRNGSRQTTSWSGSGIPCSFEERRLIKDRSTWSDPN